MCIRDREGTVSVSGLGGNPYRDGSFEYYMSEKLRTNDAKGCLLYTSDAADERSSVDLGGRRIIKKKQLYRLSYLALARTKTSYNSGIYIRNKNEIETKHK